MQQQPTPELAECRRLFQRNRVEAEQGLEGMSRVQVSWRPEPGGWSVAQCLIP